MKENVHVHVEQDAGPICMHMYMYVQLYVLNFNEHSSGQCQKKEGANPG